ncbi:MAG TPA: heparinase II/III family protein [Hyphomicrobiaceae bacterium]|nr:heparinase II/III family protein [Hyphomicrobiaceae bacterium]
MTPLTLAERAHVARLATDRLGRYALSRVLGSRLLRWQFGAPLAEDILLVPQELRTADPSFADELAQGLFGLGGAVAHIGEGSVFSLPAPSVAWAEELHGFGWLRDLRAARQQAAWDAGRQAVLDWVARGKRNGTSSHAPHVTGRRIISWLANAEMLLVEIDRPTYDRIADSLGDQLILLSARWRDSPGGYPRLISLIGLLTGALCIAGHDKQISRTETALVNELSKQLLADGGHISRNPAVVVDLLLDLLPLRTCFHARQRAVPSQLQDAIERMHRFLRHMRLGDGSLGRFNGMGTTPIDNLATLLSYDEATDQPLASAATSHYAKVSRGSLVLLADTGPPPPLRYAGQAAAGCLSFELSIGRQAVFVNGGKPGPAEQDWLSASRATANHNTLMLGAESSARMVRQALVQRLVGGVPIRLPNRAWGWLTDHADSITLEGEHDGYMPQYQLLHRRKLVLDNNGTRLSGEDTIASPGATTRLPRDIPYSIHFHLHPALNCRMGEEPGLVIISIPGQPAGGGLWYFNSEKATISVEDSIHFADHSGPRRSQQIVLRGACFGDTRIRWSLEQLGEAVAR